MRAQRTRWLRTFSASSGARLFPPTNQSPRISLWSPPVASGAAGCFRISDIDLLFLFGDREAEQASKTRFAASRQELWDLRLKLSPASRTLPSVTATIPNNTEFTISLLDCRYLARRS